MKLFVYPFLLAGVLIAGWCAPASEAAPPVTTFSIVGFDPRTGDLGVAVESKFFGVGTVVPWAAADVGAVATQSYANIRFGPEGLRLLRKGGTAQSTLDTLIAGDNESALRQVGIVDAEGRAAAFTGEACHPWAGHHTGNHYTVQGNLLVSSKVVDAMQKAFESTREARDTDATELADWLMAALIAGQKAGGDRRGRQSAALLVVRKEAGYDGANDRYIDLRVEDHTHPIQELARLLAIHKSFYRQAHENPPSRPTQAKPK